MFCQKLSFLRHHVDFRIFDARSRMQNLEAEQLVQQRLHDRTWLHFVELAKAFAIDCKLDGVDVG